MAQGSGLGKRGNRGSFTPKTARWLGHSLFLGSWVGISSCQMPLGTVPPSAQCGSRRDSPRVPCLHGTPTFSPALPPGPFGLASPHRLPAATLATEGLGRILWLRLQPHAEGCVSVCGSLSLGRPAHVVPKCQPPTQLSPTYRRLRTTGTLEGFC